MEPLNRHLSSALTPTAEPPSPPSARPASNTALRTLWARMTEIYGHRWTATFGESADSNPAAETWGKGLAGVTGEQLADGLRACITSADPWPPTLPEFRGKCLGIPAFGAVKGEFLKPERDWVFTPFSFLLAQHLDRYAFRHASQDNAVRMLQDAYAAAREHVMGGGELPEVPVAAIEQDAPQFTPADPDKAKASIAEIQRMLRGEE